MPAIELNNGVMRLSGDLTLSTVAERYRTTMSLWREPESPGIVDLAATGRIDSAGLALLLEWQSIARLQGKTLALRNPPADLLHLAGLCEATELLGVDVGGNGPGHTQENGA